VDERLVKELCRDYIPPLLVRVRVNNCLQVEHPLAGRDEREIRREMTDVCESHAVHVFARNLRNLLLQSESGSRKRWIDDHGDAM
jgi:hypothetical protein